MVISMAIITRVKTRNIMPPIGISHSVQSELLLVGGDGGGSDGDSASSGAGTVIKAPTALQAL
jgi:hypothetical protein